MTITGKFIRRLATALLLIAAFPRIQAQTCASGLKSDPIEACVKIGDYDPCPVSPGITIQISCRIEDCYISVIPTEARRPFLDRVKLELSDGWSNFVRGPDARIRHIFPFPGTTDTLISVKATPYWKDTGVGIPATQEYVMDADIPYFGYNTNLWGLTVEFGTSFGNMYDWRYTWDYGDGTVGQNKSWTATCKTYDVPGHYLVTLRMLQTNNCASTGCQDYTVTQYIDVPNRAPEATFTYSNTLKKLSVNASATRDEPGVEETWHTGINYNCGMRRTNAGLQYEWDWGDGTFGSGMNATHDYAASGIYKVTLLVRDHLGATHSKSQSVSIPDDPAKPAFSFNCHGGTCDFDAGASTVPNATAYVWTFNQVVGTGTVPTAVINSGINPKVSYTFGNGIFRATLQVQTAAGLSAGVTRELRSSTRVAEGLTFIPILPCRLIDTQESGQLLSSGQTLQVGLVGGAYNHCALPLGVSAIAANIVTDARGNPGGRSWLHAFRPGWYEADRTTAQYYNSTWATGIRANNTIVEAAADKINLVPVTPNGGTTRLIVDVTGYFVKATHANAAQGLKFATTPFCTWYKSAEQNTPLVSGTPQYVAMSSCAPPATADVASLHFTAIAPTSNGHIVVTPGNYTSIPIFSTVNVWANLIVRNGWIAKIGRASMQGRGDYRLDYSSIGPGQSMQYQIAVNGWFQSDGPLVYYPIDPCRMVDTTRPADTGQPRAAANVVQSYQIRGNCGVPKGATAVVLNASALNPAGSGDLALFPSDAGLYPGNAQQLAVFENFYAGDDMTVGAIVPLSTQHELDLGLKARFFDTDVRVDVVGYFGPPGLTNTAEAPEVQ